MLGTDFAGRRCDTGERVMGFALNRAFGTNVETREDFLIPIPDNWSMDEGVTLLSTYSTVWYGLIERANIKRGINLILYINNLLIIFINKVNRFLYILELEV
jgi:NADPH:quinone reductase-like Zn-dependent oxidoreductase